MNDQDKDRQDRALKQIKTHFRSVKPKQVAHYYDVAQLNDCWPCVEPIFDQLLLACEQADSGWTSAQSEEVRNILFK